MSIAEATTQARVWVNLPPLIFDSLQDLIRRLGVGDCRAIYLITFCRILSMALIKRIEDWTEYQEIQRLHPLPDDPMEVMEFHAFAQWVSTFESIMRASGMIGNGRKRSGEEGLQLSLEFPLEEDDQE